eukprot:TRINITY_DN3950_c0_g1_i1.p1 TRINITY_DN3950_c0_g1~~TRINITY_DN3950_c0_g1_i1.p1  ORF type:complete len:1685 (+),score=428.43 TRINITY_DN3950_c0_g1_i1:54-5108(+)
MGNCASSKGDASAPKPIPDGVQLQQIAKQQQGSLFAFQKAHSWFILQDRALQVYATWEVSGKPLEVISLRGVDPANVRICEHFPHVFEMQTSYSSWFFCSPNSAESAAWVSAIQKAAIELASIPEPVYVAPVAEPAAVVELPKPAPISTEPVAVVRPETIEPAPVAPDSPSTFVNPLRTRLSSRRSSSIISTGSHRESSPDAPSTPQDVTVNPLRRRLTIIGQRSPVVDHQSSQATADTSTPSTPAASQQSSEPSTPSTPSGDVTVNPLRRRMTLILNKSPVGDTAAASPSAVIVETPTSANDEPKELVPETSTSTATTPVEPATTTSAPDAVDTPVEVPRPTTPLTSTSVETTTPIVHPVHSVSEPIADLPLYETQSRVSPEQRPPTPSSISAMRPPTPKSMIDDTPSVMTVNPLRSRTQSRRTSVVTHDSQTSQPEMRPSTPLSAMEAPKTPLHIDLVTVAEKSALVTAIAHEPVSDAAVEPTETPVVDPGVADVDSKPEEKPAEQVAPVVRVNPLRSLALSGQIVLPPVTTVVAPPPPPPPPAGPFKEGRLVKQGNSWKSWKERWFILSGNMLKYYRPSKIDDGAELGTISLSDVKPSSVVISSEEHGFRVASVDGEKARTYVIRARSDEERNEWVEAIRESIRYHSALKLPTPPPPPLVTDSEEPKNHVRSPSLTPSSPAALALDIGARVDAGGIVGVVRFVGNTQFAPGRWVGVELDEPKGKNDGSVAGVVYFRTEPAHGLFVRPAKCIVLNPSPATIFIAADSSLPPTKEGVLSKQAGSAKEWKKRYAIMRDNELRYYRLLSGGAGAEVGVVPLKGAIVLASPTEPHAIRIEHMDGTRSRAYVLRAHDDADRDAWIAMISASIKYFSVHSADVAVEPVVTSPAAVVPDAPADVSALDMSVSSAAAAEPAAPAPTADDQAILAAQTELEALKRQVLERHQRTVEVLPAPTEDGLVDNTPKPPRSREPSPPREASPTRDATPAGRFAAVVEEQLERKSSRASARERVQERLAQRLSKTLPKSDGAASAVPVDSAVVVNHVDAAVPKTEFGTGGWDEQQLRVALLASVNAGSVSEVRAFLKFGALPNTVDEDGIPVLHQAARSGDVGLAVALLDAGADVNASSAAGTTALLVSAQEQHFDLALLLVERGAVGMVSDEYGLQPIHAAAVGSGVQLINRLLASGANINAAAADGLTPLLASIRARDMNVLRLLLRRGADPCLADTHGHAAVHEAALNDWADAIGVLATNAADLKQVDRKGRTALHIASATARSMVAMAILAAAGSAALELLLLEDADSASPIQLAINSGDRSLVKAILRKHVNAPNPAGDTPVHLAVRSRNTDIAQLLLQELKADPNAQNAVGNTPLHVAAQLGSVEMMQLLISAKADLNLTNGAGLTPAHLAVEHVAALVYLVEAGADVNVEDRLGATVMQVISPAALHEVHDARDVYLMRTVPPTKQELLYIVTAGAFLEKHGREGMPHQRFVWVSSDLQKLCWTDAKLKPDDESTARFIMFDSIEAAARGHTTSTFARTGRAGTEDKCFSLHTAERTLDFEADKRSVAMQWVLAVRVFRGLLTSVERAIYDPEVRPPLPEPTAQAVNPVFRKRTGTGTSPSSRRSSVVSDQSAMTLSETERPAVTMEQESSEGQSPARPIGLPPTPPPLVRADSVGATNPLFRRKSSVVR